MIKIRCRPDAGDFLLTVEGHTDKDICAAVSAIVQTAALGLKAMAKTHPASVTFKEVRADEKRAPP